MFGKVLFAFWSKFIVIVAAEATTIPSEPIIRVGEHCQKSPVKYELIIIKCVRGGYDISTFFMRKIWKSSFKIFKNINIFLLNLEECIYNVELVP